MQENFFTLFFRILRGNAPDCRIIKKSTFIFCGVIPIFFYYRHVVLSLHSLASIGASFALLFLLFFVYFFGSLIVSSIYLKFLRDVGVDFSKTSASVHFIEFVLCALSQIFGFFGLILISLDVNF